MGGIAEGTEIGVVRRDDVDGAAWAHQAMEFLNRADDVGYVLDHVYGPQLIERIVAERVREMVEVADDVGVRPGVAIDANRAGVLIDPAADVEDAHVAVILRGTWIAR